MPSWKQVELSLLLNEARYLPQSFKREQGWFCSVRSGFRCPYVISQARCDGSVIPIRHTDDEIRVRSSADPNELHALTVQGMVWVGDRHPFQRWFVKGGSVL